jgi:hypothetical protein
MKRFVRLAKCALTLSMIAAVCVGCDHSAERKAAAALAASKGPEPTFQRIVDSFRRKVEDQPVNLIVSEGGTRTTMVGSNKVTSELVPPATPNDRYKGTITVTSQSQYSLRRSTTADEKEHDQSAQKPHKNPLDPVDKNGNEYPTTADRTPKPNDDGKNEPKKEPQETVTRRPDVQTRKYELVYENNKWLLTTTLDLKTEKSIQFAFDEALSIQ